MTDRRRERSNRSRAVGSDDQGDKSEEASTVGVSGSTSVEAQLSVLRDELHQKMRETVEYIEDMISPHTFDQVDVLIARTEHHKTLYNAIANKGTETQNELFALKERLVGLADEVDRYFEAVGIESKKLESLVVEGTRLIDQRYGALEDRLKRLEDVSASAVPDQARTDQTQPSADTVPSGAALQLRRLTSDLFLSSPYYEGRGQFDTMRVRMDQMADHLRSMELTQSEQAATISRLKGDIERLRSGGASGSGFGSVSGVGIGTAPAASTAQPESSRLTRPTTGEGPERKTELEVVVGELAKITSILRRGSQAEEAHEQEPSSTRPMEGEEADQA